MLTFHNLPFEEEKWPDKSDFPRSIEVDPSDKIKNHKLKKVMLDEMTLQNASKFVIFHVHKHPDFLFPFSISCGTLHISLINA